MPTLLGLLESLLCWQITVLLSGSGPLWPFVATLQVRPFGPFGRLEFGLSPSTESAGLQAAFSSGGYLGECCFRLIISIVTSTSMDCDDYCLRLLLLLLLATPPPPPTNHLAPQPIVIIIITINEKTAAEDAGAQAPICDSCRSCPCSPALTVTDAGAEAPLSA